MHIAISSWWQVTELLILTWCLCLWYQHILNITFNPSSSELHTKDIYIQEQQTAMKTVCEIFYLVQIYFKYKEFVYISTWIVNRDEKQVSPELHSISLLYSTLIELVVFSFNHRRLQSLKKVKIRKHVIYNDLKNLFHRTFKFIFKF